MEEAGTPVRTMGERRGDATSDEALLDLVARGDDEALGELYDRHGHTAYGLAVRILRDRSLAEDAVQEAFLGLWQSAGRFRAARGSARSWILTLVHRRAVDAVRREERSRATSEVIELERAWSESTEDVAALRTERRAIQNALELLPSSHRHLLELAYYGGLTQTELAHNLGLPLGTIKSRTHTALSRLQEILSDESALPQRVTAGVG